MDITRDVLPKTLHKIRVTKDVQIVLAQTGKKGKGIKILRRVVPLLHFPVDETGSLSLLDFPEKPKIPFSAWKCVWG